jgi:hypothetical protein
VVLVSRAISHDPTLNTATLPEHIAKVRSKRNTSITTTTLLQNITQ